MNTIFSSVFMVLIASTCTCSNAALSSQWNNTIYVDPYNGNDTGSCTTSDSIHDACATIAYVMNKLKKSTQVILVSGIHSVSGKILIRNCQHIAVTGMDPGNTTIKCTDGSNAGFEFVGVSDIQIIGIEIKKLWLYFQQYNKRSDRKNGLI